MALDYLLLPLVELTDRIIHLGLFQLDLHLVLQDRVLQVPLFPLVFG
jgi:hypothetical protein